MRGKFLHNHGLIDPLESESRERGAQTQREFPTGPGRDAAFVDLMITYGTLRIACEAELTTDRVINDVRKAVALNAHTLLIVVPNSRLACAVRRRFGPVSRVRAAPEAYRFRSDVRSGCYVA